MNAKMQKHGKIAKALSSECRLLLIEWLREPDRHFVGRRSCPYRRQVVAVSDIQGKWNVAQGTAMKHILLLADAQLVTVSKRDKVRWITRNSRGLIAARALGYGYVR